MDKSEEQKVGRELTDEEEKEFREGSALYEMDQTSVGWKVVKGILENLTFHSWVDPRETTDEKDFLWRELNAFHAANNVKELLENIATMISRADYLGKVKTGEIKVRKFNI